MKEKIGYIYKITSPIGRIYIGQTINLNQRLRSYKNLFTHRQKRLHRSLLKYGWDNHTFEIIEECCSSVIDDREIFYIKYYNSFDTENGLNLTSGGKGGRHTTQTLIRISNFNRNRKVSEATKEKLRILNTGKKQSAETIKKRQLKIKGLKRTQETKDRISKAKLGIKLSEKHIQSLKNAVRKPISEEQKRKLSEKLKGKPCPWSRGNNHSGRKVINTINGKIYESLKIASKAIGVNYNTVKNGLGKGKTNYTYLEWLDFSERVSINIWDKLSKKNKIIFNTCTGIFYEEATLAAKSINVNICSLHDYLNKRVKNKTNFIYV